MGSLPYTHPVLPLLQGMVDARGDMPLAISTLPELRAGSAVWDVHPDVVIGSELTELIRRTTKRSRLGKSFGRSREASGEPRGHVEPHILSTVPQIQKLTLKSICAPSMPETYERGGGR